MRVPILMMTNAGGVLPTAVLNDRPAFALFSGPAAGVIGSLAMGERLGLKNLLTIDIGGTSFDVGVVVDGRPLMRREISVAGADIRVPSIDVASIGAGGGSIAAVRFGNLTVGPQSAGANPGPACYDRGGTEPTATDADLVLGVLDPEQFHRRAHAARRRGRAPRHLRQGGEAARHERASKLRGAFARCSIAAWRTCCGDRPSSAATIRASSRCSPTAAPVPRMPGRWCANLGSTASSCRPQRRRNRRSAAPIRASVSPRSGRSICA